MFSKSSAIGRSRPPREKARWFVAIYKLEMAWYPGGQFQDTLLSSLGCMFSHHFHKDNLRMRSKAQWEKMKKPESLIHEREGEKKNGSESNNGLNICKNLVYRR